MANAISFTNVIASFPKLITPESNKDFPNSPKKFALDLIITPDNQAFAQFMEEIGKQAVEKWKDKANLVLQSIQADRRLRCFGNGSEKIKKATMLPYEGYAGMRYISASSNEDRPPIIFKPEDGRAIDNLNTMERTTAARKIYGGCHVNVAVRPWLQDNAAGRAVRCELIAVQFCGDGTPFGDMAPDVTGMFGAVAPAAADPAAPALPAWM